MNILHITPDFNYACGRSYYVYLLLKYFGKSDNVYLISNGGDSFQRLDELDIPYHIIKKLKSKNPVSYSKNIRKLRSFIKEFNIDIIHSHHRYSELLAVQAVRKLSAKTVFTSLSIVKKKYNIEYKSDRIIAVSNSIKKMLTERFNIDEGKISLIPNFTDTDELNNKFDIPRNDNFFNILAVGRFHNDKNFKILLKALKVINNPAIRLVLVGEGDKDIYYKKYIRKHSLNVEINGPQKNLSRFFSACDICVLPSARDPFPNFMLQAGLFKKPFIGTNVDGIGQLIKDFKNGLLFKSGDAEELAKKIIVFKNNVVLAQTCAENLHNEVMDKYTEKTIIPQIQKLYNDVI